MPDGIPEGITRADVEQAIADYDAGASHRFGPSTKYDILFDSHRYPPKSIVGLAARRIAGRTLEPEDFKGGEESRCFRLLQRLGFEIVPKGDNEQPSGPRNPPWQRDELILALDLYFRYPPQQLSSAHPEVVELSELLNALPIHVHRPDAVKFRNPNGVYMELNNFTRFDPDRAGAGLTRGGKLQQVIWDEFASDRNGLRRLAQAITDGYPTVPTDVQLADDDESEFPEGRILYRLHRQRERNTALVKELKGRASAVGCLHCVVCRFDFAEAYGDLGRGYIECHHALPISEYIQGQKTKLKDLALVCANCHRMLHRRRPWLSIAELNHLRS